MRPQVKLNIQEVAMPVPMAAPAAAAAGAAAADAGAAAAAAAAPAAKTAFKVTLAKIDPAAKAKIIKEIKGMLPGANLVEAKKFVEGAPKVIREDVPKEEAEKMKAALEALGASVTLE